MQKAERRLQEKEEVEKELKDRVRVLETRVAEVSGEKERIEKSLRDEQGINEELYR